MIFITPIIRYNAIIAGTCPYYCIYSYSRAYKNKENNNSKSYSANSIQTSNAISAQIFIGEVVDAHTYNLCFRLEIRFSILRQKNSRKIYGLTNPI